MASLRLPRPWGHGNLSQLVSAAWRNVATHERDDVSLDEEKHGDALPLQVAIRGDDGNVGMARRDGRRRPRRGSLSLLLLLLVRAVRLFGSVQKGLVVRDDGLNFAAHLALFRRS
jgi:hypothetical protein